MTRPRTSRTPPTDSAPRASAADAQPGHGLEHSIGYMLNRAANMIAARFNDDLQPHDINLQAWRVMAALGSEDPQSMTDLADHTAAELSYLSRSVSSVEKRGLLVRNPSPKDKRTVLLSLTPAGRALLKKLLPRRDQIEAIALAGVRPRDIETTLATLRTIYSNLVDAPASAVGTNRKLTVARRVRRREATDAESDRPA